LAAVFTGFIKASMLFCRRWHFCLGEQRSPWGSDGKTQFVNNINTAWGHGVYEII